MPGNDDRGEQRERSDWLRTHKGYYLTARQAELIRGFITGFVMSLAEESPRFPGSRQLLEDLQPELEELLTIFSE